MKLIIVFLLTLNISKMSSKPSKSKCTVCRDFVKKFTEGLEKTSASNFGGGNTNWEEKNLGSFIYSETRLLEILDSSCSEDNKNKCHQLIEENEELLEDWWFNRFARNIDTDLFLFFCVESLKTCCPDGFYGKECKECTGGAKLPCNGNGVCEGNGTRGGNGSCSCNLGYSGEFCDKCQPKFYKEEAAAKVTCLACSPACNITCSDVGAEHCFDCANGWTFTTGKGCSDIDECAENLANCSHGTFCSNVDGTYNCADCHPACNGCTSYGHHKCLECSSKHFLSEEICKDCHISCRNTCTDESASSCDSCGEGWILSELNECIDIDECSTENNCASNMYCSNTPGSFHCQGCNSLCARCVNADNKNCLECKAGYSLNEDGTCIDIDECSTTEACVGEFEACVNSDGGFKCECIEGYVRRMGSGCFKKNIVKKKKKKLEKEKVVPATLKDSENIKPGPDGFSKDDLQKLGNPLEGDLIEDPIVMEGSTQNIRNSHNDDL